MALNLWGIVVAARWLAEGCWLLALAGWAHPWRSAVVGGFGVLWALLGLHDASAVVLWVLVFAFTWWLMMRAWIGVGRVRVALGRSTLRDVPAPLDWERWVGRWLRPAWRSWRVYERDWQAAMEGAFLTSVVPNARDPYPRIEKVKTSKFGDTLTVRMLIGQTLEQWEQATDTLAPAFAAQSCRAYEVWRKRRVWAPSRDGESRTSWLRRIGRREGQEYMVPGLVQLEFSTKDALCARVPAFSVPASTDKIDLEAIPVGITEKGETWTLPVFQSHLLNVGITGAGKGSIPWSILKGLAPAIRDGLVQVWAFDPKGGMELGFGRDLFYRYFSGSIPDMADGLAELVAEMNTRTKRLELVARKHTPTVEDPFILVIIDEVARLANYKEKRDVATKLNSYLEQLINIGRAPGIGLVLSTQNATKAIVGFRDEIPTRVCLRVESPLYVDMALGQGALAKGARADRIPRFLQGAGYARLDKRGLVRVRATFIDDDEIKELAREYRPRLDPPQTAPEILKEVQQRASVDLRKHRTIERSFTVMGTPPSMNTNTMRNGKPSRRVKKEWQARFMRELDRLGLERPIAKTGPLEVEMVLTFPTRRTRDLDNFWVGGKALGDALTGKALKDRAMLVDGARVVAGWLQDDSPADWRLVLRFAEEKGPNSTVVRLTWQEGVPAAG